MAAAIKSCHFDTRRRRKRAPTAGALIKEERRLARPQHNLSREREREGGREVRMLTQSHGGLHHELHERPAP